MRKDYMPVSEADATADEDAYVQRYWTRQWADREFCPDTTDIERDEVFQMTRAYIDDLPRDARVLDGGCGTGAWPLFLARRGLDVVGLDISEATIEWLRRTCPERTWVVGDIRRTGFPAGSFDAYYSWGTFEHFEAGLQDCVSEAFRILRPGGLLCITVPFDNMRHAVRAARPFRSIESGHDPAHGYRQGRRFYQWRLTASELTRELEIGGFCVVRAKSFGKIEGIVRMLHHGLGVLPGSLASKILWRLLVPLVPGWYVDHMLLAVAFRRERKAAADPDR